MQNVLVFRDNAINFLPVELVILFLIPTSPLSFICFDVKCAPLISISPNYYASRAFKLSGFFQYHYKGIAKAMWSLKLPQWRSSIPSWWISCIEGADSPFGVTISPGWESATKGDIVRCSASWNSERESGSTTKQGSSDQLIRWETYFSAERV